MDTFDRIQELLQRNRMTQADLARKTGISTGLISQWKNRQQQPSAEKLRSVADCFGVSVDYLLTGEESTQKETPALNEKDERDISKQLDRMLKDLENAQGALMFDGEPMDELTKELLINSLRKDLEMGKKIAKQKYTPKKYRNSEGD